MNIEEFVLAALGDPRLAHLRPSPTTAGEERNHQVGYDPQGEGDDMRRIAKGTALLLREKADMLREYFKIGVESIGGQVVLTSLPVLLEVNLCFVQFWSCSFNLCSIFVTAAIRATTTGATGVSPPLSG